MYVCLYVYVDPIYEWHWHIDNNSKKKDEPVSNVTHGIIVEIHEIVQCRLD